MPHRVFSPLGSKGWRLWFYGERFYPSHGIQRLLRSTILLEILMGGEDMCISWAWVTEDIRFTFEGPYIIFRGQ
ncbi:hypothetical protein CpB0378 [Chlamydia pneumoniae TW-183]|uniref:Uncharacterized protein n=1 Tax=Chlamydia pneumoniae TaxID=83558 RepID=A0ABN3YPX1_CHLPN|nr:hypothetical protein CpB0378 [Chlamydia pneumoniae TW-183]